MGYHQLNPEDLEPSPDHPCRRHSITDAAGLGTLAAAVYVVGPGEDLATHYHSHDQREEVLYVTGGELSVETPDRTYRVPAGECLVVEPDSPIRPHVPAGASGAARVLGVGAPKYDPGMPYDPSPEG